MHLSTNTRGSLELTAAMIISGTIGYFALTAEQSTWNLVFFRCLFGALALGVYGGLRGVFNRRLFQPRLLMLIALGGITLVGNWLLLFKSFEFVPFSIATVVYHAQPLFLVIAGAWLTGDRPSRQVYGWLLIAFTGLFLIVEIDPGALISLSTNATGAVIGIALPLGAAMLYTVTTLITKEITGAPAHFVAFVQVSLGATLLLPFADFDSLPQTAVAWRSLLILGVIHTGFMYILLYASFQKLPTSLIAVLSFVYPVVALLVDHWAFDTALDLRQGVGIVLILLAGMAVKLGWSLTPGFLRAWE